MSVGPNLAPDLPSTEPGAALLEGAAVHEDTQLHAAESVTPTRSHDRDAYADVGRAYRYSCQRLYTPEVPHDLSGLKRSGASLRLAYAVHAALAGQMLASYSRTSESRRYVAWNVTTLVGLDVEKAADRKRVTRCLYWLREVGAIDYRPAAETGARRGDGDLIALPVPPSDWLDATVQRGPAYVEDAPAEDKPTPDRGGTHPRPGRNSPPTGVNFSPLSEELSEKQSEQASERDRDVNAARSLASHSVKAKQPPETARTSERESDTPVLSDTGKQAEDVERAGRLSELLPQPIKAKAAGGTATLAASILAHGSPAHRDAVRKLRTWLDAHADADLARFLAEKAKRMPPETRSLAGLVLTWLRDLDPSPPHESKHYRYGFPFRDALRVAELSGPTGVLVQGTFANAAEAVLDAGHDPAHDPDGFLATLAATLLPHVPDASTWLPDLDARPLQAFAGDARPVPWEIPSRDSWADDLSPRGTAALDLVGLAGTDPRRSKAAATGFYYG